MYFKTAILLYASKWSSQLDYQCYHNEDDRSNFCYHGCPFTIVLAMEIIWFDGSVFDQFKLLMMASSNWNLFRVTGPLCGNSPVTGEFPSQRAVMWSFDVFFDLCLNKRLSKQSWGWWLETPSRSSWRHCNATNKRSANPPRHIFSTCLHYCEPADVWNHR